MALTMTEQLKYNLYLWYFSLTQVRLIHYCRPKIHDITEKQNYNPDPLTHICTENLSQLKLHTSHS